MRLLSIASQAYPDLDPSASAHRRFVAGLSIAGIEIEILTGTTLSSGSEIDPSTWLAAVGWMARGISLSPPVDAPNPAWPYPPSHVQLEVDGPPVNLFRGPTTLPHEPDDVEVAAFLAILDHLIERARPDALIAHGADRLTAEALRRGRSAGISTVLRLRHRGPHDPLALAGADVVLAPSQALAGEIRESAGRICPVLPDFLDPATVRAAAGERKYLAYFDPEGEKGSGTFSFSQI